MRGKSGDMYLLAGFSGLMITLYRAFNWAPSVDINGFQSPEAQWPCGPVVFGVLLNGALRGIGRIFDSIPLVC